MTNRNTILNLFALGCFGLAPMAQAVGPDTDGSIPGSNNGEGIGVLVSRTSGVWNTGTGFEALSQLTSGNQNTATGLRALNSDINGGFNTATGVLSLFSNTSGFFNSATGAYSLANNIGGSNNTANGYAALYRNTANANTAIGHAALFSNTTGFFNTAAGDSALEDNTGGAGNTAIGYFALHNNTSGGGNIAIGVGSGTNLTAGDNNIYIGNVGLAGDSNTTRIGIAKTTQRTFIDGIRGVTTANAAIPVLIDTVGQLGTTSSSRRFKKEIKPMDQTSEAILGLKPVTFHYKSDASGTPQFGLIAEEVAEINPDLVVRDESGEIYTVRYDAVNAMLLNEFLKEHRKVQEQDRKMQDQEATIAQMKKGMDALVAHIKEQDSKIQKVSDRVEMSKGAAQVATIK
jgi:hypothetical protein